MASPSLNTRSRRSSLHSVPGDLESILSVPVDGRSAAKKLNDLKNSRLRRANSVEVTSLSSPRVTRSSLLAKTAILKNPIPEEPISKTLPSPKKLNTRSKRAGSESVKETSDNKSQKVTRPKRGRKANEILENDEG